MDSIAVFPNSGFQINFESYGAKSDCAESKDGDSRSWLLPGKMKHITHYLWPWNCVSDTGTGVPTGIILSYFVFRGSTSNTTLTYSQWICIWGGYTEGQEGHWDIFIGCEVIQLHINVIMLTFNAEVTFMSTFSTTEQVHDSARYVCNTFLICFFFSAFLALYTSCSYSTIAVFHFSSGSFHSCNKIIFPVWDNRSFILSFKRYKINRRTIT